jgi:hypothetical protein
MNWDYFAIIVRRDVDRFSHNDLFANEIAAAFAGYGWQSKILDLIPQSGAVFAALRDPHCKFFLTFNGFGTELQMPTGQPGRIVSAFSTLGKPVFDLMHDCPAHLSMRHQTAATHPQRHLLCTDHDYVRIAGELGIRNVRFVATITFPRSLVAAEDRDIDVLLAGGLPPLAAFSWNLDGSSIRGRLFKMVFDGVIDRCRVDLTVNPIFELRAMLEEAGLCLDVRDPDMRFLLTRILDFVKFERRHQLLQALSDLPLTLVTDREPVGLPPNVKTLPMRSAQDLLNLMSRAKVVVCPSVHPNGFHERPMSAFTAGAAVVSAPNDPLHCHFSHGTELLFFKRPDAVRDQVERALGSPEIAERGREKALALFRPERLTETILNSLAA